MRARHTCSETSGLLGGRVTEETGDGQKVFSFLISYLQGHLVLLGRLLSFYKKFNFVGDAFNDSLHPFTSNMFEYIVETRRVQLISQELVRERHTKGTVLSMKASESHKTVTCSFSFSHNQA